MKRRPYATSRYKDIYGFTLEEMAERSGRSISFVAVTLCKIDKNVGDNHRLFEDNGMQILPCPECVFSVIECTYMEVCEHAIKVGEGLKHFRDKKEGDNIINFLKKESKEEVE